MNTYFLERGPHTSGAQLALRFPLPRFIVDGLTIEKRVTVQLAYQPERNISASASHDTPVGADEHRLTISWQPTGTGPLPSFEGSVTATERSADTATLTVSGAYTPPGGIAGTLFDELIGVRIARATLAALLEQLREAMDADYRMRVIP